MNIAVSSVTSGAGSPDARQSSEISHGISA
jgi:hypothetical protein